MYEFNYTTELRNFFESLPVNSDQSLPHPVVIENGRKALFNFEYPIFDENYRQVFETHFIRNFYLRQIGMETFGLFKFHLETWLLINMPYWNKMFESELLKYDPLTNAKMEVTHTKKNDKTQNDHRNIKDSINTTEKANMEGSSDSEQSKIELGEGTVSDDNFNRQLESTTPDSRLHITTNDGAGIIEYASKIDENKEKNTRSTDTEVHSTDTGKQTSTVDSERNLTGDNTKLDTLNSTIVDLEDYVQSRVGKIGVQSFAKLVQEYRSALLRIEKQIFNEMNELFMLLY